MYRVGQVNVERQLIKALKVRISFEFVAMDNLFFPKQHNSLQHDPDRKTKNDGTECKQ